MFCSHPISTLFPYTTLFRSAFCAMRVSSSGTNHVGTNMPLASRRSESRSSESFVSASVSPGRPMMKVQKDRKSTRLNSSHVEISYAVFCLKKKKRKKKIGLDIKNESLRAKNTVCSSMCIVGWTNRSDYEREYVKADEQVTRWRLSMRG